MPDVLHGMQAPNGGWQLIPSASSICFCRSRASEMVDRVALLGAIAKADLPTAAQEKVNDLLDKVIAITLAGLPLTEAQGLTPAQKSELAIALHHNLTRADAVKVAKIWEPKRKIDPVSSHTDIANSLIELLNKERQPFTPIMLSLGEARALPEAERMALAHLIVSIAPTADLKKLLKKWDGKNAALRTAPAAEQAKHLVKLLEDKATSDQAWRRNAA
jgi:hypothetical protein